MEPYLTGNYGTFNFCWKMGEELFPLAKVVVKLYQWRLRALGVHSNHQFLVLSDRKELNERKSSRLQVLNLKLRHMQENCHPEL